MRYFSWWPSNEQFNILVYFWRYCKVLQRRFSINLNAHLGKVLLLFVAAKMWRQLCSIYFLQQATRTQSVYPVCIRQIFRHSGEEFKPFGVQTQIVRKSFYYSVTGYKTKTFRFPLLVCWDNMKFNPPKQLMRLKTTLAQFLLSGGWKMIM